MENTETIRIMRCSETGVERVDELVAREWPLTIRLNDRELVTLLCSPSHAEALAIGFLASEGLINNRADVDEIVIDAPRGLAHVRTAPTISPTDQAALPRFMTTGFGKGTTFQNPTETPEHCRVTSDATVTTAQVAALVAVFLGMSNVYHKTGCVHSAALCANSEPLVFMEDVGRHNALDKIFGHCLLAGVDPAGKILVCTGRISSEMLLKVAQRNIPIVISKSAPTALGVRLAEQLNLTLIGFVRGRKMNIYAHPWRVLTDFGQPAAEQ